MLKKLFLITTIFTIVTVLLFLNGCNSSKKTAKELLGAGATFPYPLYSLLFNEYYKEHNVKVNYQAIGSGGGIRQILNKTVDFGGTDAFMNDKELAKANAKILHIPTCIGAVVISYNINGSPDLKLTPNIIADIFLGKIKKWNDKKIQAINPGIQLPDGKIMVIHRSDGSGTTFVFSDYLTKVSREWATRVGKGKSLNWPVGLGGKGNPGVAGLIKQTPGSIGYIELIYALQNKIKFASVKNKKGNFVVPSLETVSLAAAGKVPADTRVSITDTDSPKGYPISSFTWLIFYQEQNYNGRDIAKAKSLMNLLWWIIHDGQKYPKNLDYAPIPKSVVKKAEKILKSVTYNGKTVL